MKLGKHFLILMLLFLVAGVRVYGQTTVVDNFNRASLGTDWVVDPTAYQIVSNSMLDNVSTEAGWNYYAIFLPIVDPTEVSYKWDLSGDIEGANSGGIIMRYDRTLHNGYFVLRRYGNIDLHPIISGIIKRDVVINSAAPSLPNPKPGDVLKVVGSSDGTGHIFKVYINGTLDGTVKDASKLYGNGSNLHGGLALYGQRNNNIDDYTTKGNVPPGPIESITISSPNGGETWYANSSHNILWTSLNFTGNVKIELSTNGGTSYTTIAASVANTGSYAWTVPNSPSTTCRIRISDVVDNNPTDISNANFTIAPEPIDLVVTYPNGGEILYSSSIETISWTSTVYTGNVKIELSLDGGITYSVVTASTPNNGSYSWTVPASYSTQCRIRISDTVDGDPVDVSNADFEISDVPPDLQVLSPNGAENWIIGTQQEIRWTGPGSSTLPYVRIDYSIDDGATWTTIITSTENDGSFMWTVPGQITTHGRVRVQDASDGLPSDISDNPFSISALVHLKVNDSSGQPGSTNNLVTIWMDNLTNVRGVSFRVTDNPNNLTAANVVAVGRASGFTVTRAENGTSVFVFMVHMSGGIIPVGAGPIAQISYDVASGATVGSFSDMALSEVTVADANSNLVVPELTNGKFYFVIKGDLDKNSVVDINDINRAAEIVMKTGTPMTPYELMAGDLDNDGDVDLFDLLVIFDLVY
ncbi:hypothetical protein JXO59_13745 [candidate division KSB1 bacterium]|nr:hypothetical protein [candidate division KSB1 bacterium]